MQKKRNLKKLIAGITIFVIALLGSGYGLSIISDKNTNLDSKESEASTPQQQIKKDFIYVEGSQLKKNGKLYKVIGANYFQSTKGWRSMWIHWDKTTISEEIKLAADSGINTLRIFYYDSNENWINGTPDPVKVKQFNEIINISKDNNVYLIVTLFDLDDGCWSSPKTGGPINGGYNGSYCPDHEVSGLKTPKPNPTAEQRITYLNKFLPHYKDEYTIMAWDLANELDTCWQDGKHACAGSKKTEILQWFEKLHTKIKKLNPNHLITIGMAGYGYERDIKSYAKFCDFISMHHYNTPNIENWINPMRQLGINKPILVEEGGRSAAKYNESEQRAYLQSILSKSVSLDTAGFMWWIVVDMSKEYSSKTHLPEEERLYGLYKADYTPRKVVNTFKNFNWNGHPEYLDTKPPGCSFCINDCTTTVAEQDIKLTKINYLDKGIHHSGVDRVRFSNDKIKWKEFSIDDIPQGGINWKLDKNNRSNVVYMQARDGAGNWGNQDNPKTNFYEVQAAFANDKPPKEELKADINQDGKVDGKDYGIILGDWVDYYDNNKLNNRSDLNGNGKIDGPDYTLFLQGWSDYYD